MEYYENGFLEELLALRSDNNSWEASIAPMAINKNNDDFYYNYSNVVWNNNNNSNNSSLDCVEENQIFPILPPPHSSTTTNATNSFDDHTNFLPIFDQTLITNSSSFFNAKDFHVFRPYENTDVIFGDSAELSPQLTESSNAKLDTPAPPPPFHYQEEIFSSSVFEEEVIGFHHSCKMEPVICGGGGGEMLQLPGGSFNIGSLVGPAEKKPKLKKLHGQPSKNLMAERRRRKRLNDRLSMLRSIVPKISKMDRTSILGDTIDYMKELLERINHLQEEMEVGPHQLRLMSIFKDVKPDESSVRNSPKFDVERRGPSDTRVEISCSAKPGLLLSTVTTLESLGLEIQHCVINCFNDFALRASCIEELEQMEVLNSEEMKHALFRNAGYGGRCL